MKDQFVIACVESPKGAQLLLPWATHFAHRLNNKNLLLLNVSQDGNSDWLKQYGIPYIGLRGDWKTAVDGLPTAFNGILAITAVDTAAPRNSITNPKTLLRTFRDCKIAYLVVGNENRITDHPLSVTLTLDHRRESKEKLIWASYLVRFLGAKLTVALPDYSDDGLRSRQHNNVRYLEKTFASLGIDYTTTTIAASTFTHPDITALDTLKSDLLVAMTTDRRDRDIGDWLLGTSESKLLQHPSRTPLLLLNQRDDLYVLCD